GSKPRSGNGERRQAWLGDGNRRAARAGAVVRDYATAWRCCPGGATSNSAALASSVAAITANIDSVPCIVSSGSSSKGAITAPTRFSAQAAAIEEARERVGNSSAP